MNDNEFKKMAGRWLFIQERVKKFLANQVKISLSFFSCRTNCTALCMLSSLAFICPSDRQMSKDFESCGQAAASAQWATLVPPGRAGRPAKQRAPPRNPREGLGLEAEPADVTFCTRNLLTSSVQSSDERSKGYVKKY